MSGEEAELRFMERVISAASGAALTAQQREEQIQANAALDATRGRPDAWMIGLQIMARSADGTAQVFALSLLRTYLSTVARNAAGDDSSRTNVACIRENLLAFIGSNVAATNLPSYPPIYIVNSIATVLALCIKIEFPYLWPSAFHDMLAIGSSTDSGLELTVRVLVDVVIEIVQYDVQRSKAEVTLNSAIKDHMRSTTIVKDIIEYLCSSAVACRSRRNGELSEKCLRCLADLVGWVDVNLISSDKVLSTIYSSLQDDVLSGSGCACLAELVKKGMDIGSKINLVLSINLLPVLNNIPIGDSDDTDGCEDELGVCVNALAEELLTALGTYESALSTQNYSEENLAIINAAPHLIGVLRMCLDLLLRLFAHPDSDVVVTVIPAVTKMVHILKVQKACEARPAAAGSPARLPLPLSAYLPQVLRSLYRQIQLPSGFSFEELFDEGSELLEFNAEVRKLFVNIARVAADPCLQLISSAFAELRAPMSTAPMTSLEAVLKLLYSLSECGPAALKALGEGALPTLVNTLHATDIAAHKSALVLLAYFEVSVRYLKMSDPAHTPKIVTALIGPQGLRHPQLHVRCRAAYFLLKVTEGMDGKAALLLPIVGSLADLLLSSAVTITDAGVASNGVLNESSELYLLESIGIMTLSSYQCTDAVIEMKRALLSDMIRTIISQIDSISALRTGLADTVAELLAHKISCFSSLMKGYSHKNYSDMYSLFEQAAVAVAKVTQSYSEHDTVRQRVVMFEHRSINTLGLRAVGFIESIFAPLLAHSSAKDAEAVVQPINQLAVEFGSQVIVFLNKVFPLIVGKYSNIIRQFEESNGSVPTEAPHLELERMNHQKNYLIYLAHVCMYDCSGIFLSDGNKVYLGGVLSFVLQGLRGGSGKISKINQIPLRKNSALVTTHLARAWHAPIDGGLAAVSDYFNRLLYDSFVPTAIAACVDGSVDMTDAAAHTFLAEVGSLLWTMYTAGDPSLAARNLGYFQELFARFGVPADGTAAITAALATGPPMQCHLFREVFKKNVCGKGGASSSR